MHKFINITPLEVYISSARNPSALIVDMDDIIHALKTGDTQEAIVASCDYGVANVNGVQYLLTGAEHFAEVGNTIRTTTPAITLAGEEVVIHQHYHGIDNVDALDDTDFIRAEIEYV